MKRLINQMMISVPGAILVCAALFKLYGLVAGLAPSDGSWIYSRPLVVMQVGIESILGLWLLVGIRRVWARRVGIALFLCFACVALTEAMLHKKSCGCFGPLEVNPWHTLVLDLLVLFGLCLCCRQDPTSSVARDRLSYRRVVIITTLILAVFSVTAWKAVVASPPAVASDPLGAAGSLVVMEPEKWLGHRLPIASHIVGDAELNAGHWLLVLYHADCGECQQVVPKYQQLAHTFAREHRDEHLAFVEMPPYASPTDAIVHPDADFSVARLDRSRDWFVQTPVLIEMQDGLVTNVKQGEDVKLSSPGIVSK